MERYQGYPYVNLLKRKKKSKLKEILKIVPIFAKMLHFTCFVEDNFVYCQCCVKRWREIADTEELQKEGRI